MSDTETFGRSAFMDANAPAYSGGSMSGFSGFLGGVERLAGKVAENFAPDPAVRQRRVANRMAQDQQDAAMLAQRRQEIGDRFKVLLDLIKGNPLAMQSEGLQKVMQSLRSEANSVDAGLADQMQGIIEVASRMPSEAAKPTILPPGAKAFGPNGELLFENPRAEGGAQSPVGKLLADRQELVDIHGEGSDQVRRFDELASRDTNGIKLSDVSALRSQHAQASKTFIDVRDAFGRIQSSLERPSPASDLSLIFGYMRMLDPASTVREGEFATAQNTTGVPTQVRNFYNRVLTGERLSPEQRQDFFTQARGLYGKAEATQAALDSQYGEIAARAGINPSDVVINYRGMGGAGGNATGTAGAPASSEAAPQGRKNFAQMGRAELLAVDVSRLSPAELAEYEKAVDRTLGGQP